MRQPKPTVDTVSAREAAELLGVQRATLYAYVSRGRLRSLPGPDRERRYPRADVERLRATRGARGDVARHEDRLVRGALRWGAPVLETEITEVTAAGPIYRGHPAVALAERGVSFEAVAELLWTGTLPDTRPRWPGGDRRAAVPARALPTGAEPIAVLAALVPALAARDPARFEIAPGALWPRARRIVRAMTAALARSDAARGGGATARVAKAQRARSVARALAAALGARGGAAGIRALEQALVLWADHELNVSTFAARVAASADADLYSCVSAGLAALAGPKHGGACARIEALVAEAGAAKRVRTVLNARARRGEPLPGFGHPLYPGGDPRATPILAAARRLAPSSPEVATIAALCREVERQTGALPMIDTATVALAAALGLPPGAAIGVVAVGRAAGWVAHAAEQYRAGFMIRPRARLRGPEPVEPD